MTSKALASRRLVDFLPREITVKNHPVARSLMNLTGSEASLGYIGYRGTPTRLRDMKELIPTKLADGAIST